MADRLFLSGANKLLTCPLHGVEQGATRLRADTRALPGVRHSPRRRTMRHRKTAPMPPAGPPSGRPQSLLRSCLRRSGACSAPFRNSASFVLRLPVFLPYQASQLPFRGCSVQPVPEGFKKLKLPRGDEARVLFRGFPPGEKLPAVCPVLQRLARPRAEAHGGIECVLPGLLAGVRAGLRRGDFPACRTPCRRGGKRLPSLPRQSSLPRPFCPRHSGCPGRPRAMRP